MSADYAGHPAPGVYSPDQCAPAPERPSSEADKHELWLEGYTYGLRNLTHPGVLADARMHALQAEAEERSELEVVRRQRDQAERVAAERGEALDRYSAELGEVRESYQRCCELVAELHEAATGRKGEGPRAGVVEDVREVRHQRDDLRRLLDRARERGDDLARELHPLREERNKLQVQARVCREDADRNAARAEKAEQALGHVNRERDAAHDARLALAHELDTVQAQLRERERMHREDVQRMAKTLEAQEDRAGTAERALGRLTAAADLAPAHAPWARGVTTGQLLAELHARGEGGPGRTVVVNLSGPMTAARVDAAPGVRFDAAGGAICSELPSCQAMLHAGRCPMAAQPGEVSEQYPGRAGG